MDYKSKVNRYLAMCQDAADKVKLCLTSDIHTSGIGGVDAKDADIVVISGDIMGGGMDSDEAGAAYLLDRFFPWARRNGDKEIVITAGNHDKFLYRLWEKRAEIDWPKNVHYLIDRAETVRGLKFYGTPWCTKDREGRFELDGKTLRYVFSKIPSGLDVLVVHTPPTVAGSDIDWSDWSQEHEGSSALADAIREKKPRLVVCGHVHGGDRKPLMVGKTKVLNVARVKDKRNEAAFKPVFEELAVES